MENYVKEITPEMMLTVDKLKKNNFEGATPDEIQTYASWTAIIAMQDDAFQDAKKARHEELEQRMRLNDEQAKASMNLLDTLAETARKKLEAVENGQTEQG